MKTPRSSPTPCPDCNDLASVPPALSRRRFLAQSTVATSALAASALLPRSVSAAGGATSETLVSTFYKSLNETQRSLICMPFDHERRLKVDNNWFVTKARFGKDFTPDQQQMLKEIYRGLHSPEYADRIMKSTEHDAGENGFGDLSVALFGEPGTGKFQCVISGRHVTKRCDGDSVAGTAFGGPIFYGHAAEGDDEKAHHPGNVYWYQALRANEVFKALDGKQRKLALLEKGRPESGTDTVKLTGAKKGLPGIPLTELSRDQRELVNRTIADLLAPYREADAREAMKLIEGGGIEHLHMAFFKNGDIGGDGVWDVWQIEGPSMISYFRGSPHVHAWLHIRDHAPQA